METSQHPLSQAKPARLKLAVMLLTGILACTVLAWTAYQSLLIEVSVQVDGQELHLRTLERRIANILDELNVVLQAEDRCLPGLETEIASPTTVLITRALPVTIEIDGGVLNVKSTATSVRELLYDQGIALAEEDRVSPDVTTALAADMEIEITRVQRFTQVIQQPLAFSVIREESSALTQGFERMVQEGQEGLQEEVVEVVAEDGIEVQRTTVRVEVVQPVVNEVIHVGTAGAYSAPGVDFTYNKVVYMETTGYDACYYCCGKYPSDPGYGITCSGLPAGYGVVGADLSVFPLGTKFYVEGYGFCVVGDTGGGIIGRNRIDLGFATHEEAVAWALRRNTAIYVLPD